MSKSGYNLWEVEKFCYLRYVGWVEIFGKGRKICKGKKRAIIKTLAPVYFLYIYIFGEYISARMIIYAKCVTKFESSHELTYAHTHMLLNYGYPGYAGFKVFVAKFEYSVCLCNFHTPI